jgi:hypothetical protein
VDARAIGDVVVDRLRKRIGLLEHHPDPRAQLHDILALVLDIAAVEPDGSRHARTRDRIVHAVEAAQEGRLAAA